MKRYFAVVSFVSALAIISMGTCQAQPSISAGGIVSAAAFGGFTSVAPGSWIEIYGTNLATTTLSWGNYFNGIYAPTSLDNTSVTIGGQSAFIDYVSPTQVNAQVPSNAPTGSQQVIVSTASGPSAPYTITVNAVEPGILAPPSFNIGGTQYAAALFSDGATYVLPPGAIAGLPSKRAQPGDTITFYGVGFGPVIPNIPAGQIVQESNTVASALQIKFGTALATTTYSGLAPSAIGLYQFNTVVPNVPSSDMVPVTFSVGGIAGTQTLYTSVQNGISGPGLSLTLTPSSVTGGTAVQGTVTLSSPAPIGGTTVSLSSTSNVASVPSTVTIAAGATSATFTISTSTVSTKQSITISAFYGETLTQTTLTVTTGSTLPQFSAITVSGTLAANQMTFSGGVLITNLAGTGYSGGITGSLVPTAAFEFAAQFGTVSVAGDTFTFSAIMPAGFMVNASGQFEISTGSVTITLAPSSGDVTVGNATGTFTLTSPLETLSGTITGTYTAESL